MNSLANFFAMGGYAVYVWPAIGLTAIVMVGLAWQSRRGLKREEQAVSELEQSLGIDRRSRGPEAGAESPVGKSHTESASMEKDSAT